MIESKRLSFDIKVLIGLFQTKRKKKIKKKKKKQIVNKWCEQKLT